MKLGVIMDPVAGVKVEKDTTLALLLAAQSRGWELYYMEMNDVYLADSMPRARARILTVTDDASDWYRFHRHTELALPELDVVLMRKDPPFNMEYIYMTYILEHAAEQGTVVVNAPAALRDINEKASITRFPQCIPPTLISRDRQDLLAFIEQHGQVILKPLDGMGGASVFRVDREDVNTNIIIETLTRNSQSFIMAQQFLAAIKQGDKRILLIDGQPYEHALARIPKSGEIRGNLAVGGTGKGVDLSDRDYWICEQVGPRLSAMGLVFVGLDVIGDYLTEINVTSPTCVRELERIYGDDIAGRVMDCVARKFAGKTGQPS
jgi:glutathione synthase